MTVAASKITPALTPPNPRIQFTAKDGTLTMSGSGSGLQVIQQQHQSVNGLTPTISCNCTSSDGQNYVLTPLNISPNVANYYSYWSFAFVAPSTSTAAVNARVTPQTGTLPNLPLLKSHGAAQCGAGDLVQGMFYVAYYVDSLNGGSGALVVNI